MLNDPTFPGSSIHFDVKEGLSKDHSTWPNKKSHTNSDTWLIKNHEKIKTLNPRLIVIDFYNKRPEAYCREFVDKVIRAFAEGSRYHGFKDSSALPQLVYNLKKYINLRDSSGRDISDKRPHHTDGTFDEAALFGDEFAQYLGYRDPGNASWLRLGELFDKGIINECWIVAPNTLYEVQGRTRKYDSSFRFKGAYNECLNACYSFGEAGKRTSVTIRLGEINVDRGVGCATHAFGHALERMALGDIPYFGKVAGRFFNFNLDTRYGAPFDTQYPCPYYVTPPECFNYSGQTITTVNNHLKGWTFKNWGEGCGNIHFPINAKFQYDYNSPQTVMCGCENYGKKNGADGADAQNAYNTDIVKQWKTSAYSDCGGEYVMYLRQNMPGYNSGTIGDDGKPMKSWWPFYFY
ncbi:MAG: hemagglutinin protein [Ferruginibacter sp.]|nr:hemagglutinin protein [Ferruginibacter sp.]